MSLAGAATTARGLFEPLLAVVFPTRCPACRDLLARPGRGPLCEGCWRGLPRLAEPQCRCGVPLGVGAGPACARCRRGRQPFAVGLSLGPYQGSLRTLVHELKYRGRQRVAARLAELLLAAPRAATVLDGAAVLVPVPLHPRRHRERGFNQAELLSRELARRTGRRSSSGAVVRRKDTPPQTGLSAAARRSNLAGAFAVRRRTEVAGRVVILVDDVLTTGATVRACAQALRDAGAVEVRVMTAARVV